MSFPVNLGDGRWAKAIYDKYKKTYTSENFGTEESHRICSKWTIREIRDACQWKKLVDQVMIEEGLIDEKLKDKLCFLTVRPKTSLVTFFEFEGDVRSFFQSDRIKEFEYCFEQKGETLDTMGGGFHFHAIIEWKYEPKELIKYAQSHFKKYVEPQCIQVGDDFHGKRIKQKKDLDRLRQYMSGNKGDDKKALACDIDKLWRAKLSLSALIKSI